MTTPLPSEMYQALVSDWTQPPAYTVVPTPLPAAATADTVTIKVLATCAHRLVRGRASGKHYSVKTLPHTPGVDGVGLVYPALTRTVYFFSWTVGSFAEYINVPRDSIFDLPPDPVSSPPHSLPIHIAASLNPAMSSYMALTRRLTPPLSASAYPNDGATILILGATSSSGIIAAQIARALGASRIIGAARSLETLSSLTPLLSSTFPLAPIPGETNFSSLPEPIDIVLDYLYGDIATAFFKTIRPLPGRPLQYIQIGQLAGPNASVGGGVLRGKDITIRGAGIGSWSDEEFRQELPGLLDVVAKLPRKEVRVEALSRVQEVWAESEGDTARRLVFVP